MSSTLCASKSTLIDETAVLNIPEPKFTRTWRPISHQRVIKSLESEIKDFGLKITNRKYSLAKGALIDGTNILGAKMFGVWDIQNGQKPKGFSASIGFRNSINKTLSVGVCAGRHVFNCDNLQMSGEFVEFKRHTGDLNDSELDDLTHRAVGKVLNRIKAFEKWLNQLKTIRLNSLDTKRIIYDSIIQEVVSTTKLTDLDSLLLGSKPSYERSLYGFHGAVTQTIRDNNLFTQSDKNDRLNNFINKFISTN